MIGDFANGKTTDFNYNECKSNLFGVFLQIV